MITPITIFGAAGKMGQAILQQIQTNKKFSLYAAIVKETNNLYQKPINHEHYYQNLSYANLKSKSVIIDVSLSEGLCDSLSLAINSLSPLVICSTGHKESQHDLIKEASAKIPILYAPNTSLMLHSMAQCCQKIAHYFPSSEASIFELHHRNKKDTPSGTSIFLADIIKKEQNTNDIKISSLRAGSGHSEHTVYFFNDFEHLEFKHIVHNRLVLAQGALIAAQFIFAQSPGLYAMKDVINSL